MALDVHPVPGTDAGYIISDVTETSQFLETTPIDLGGGLKAYAAVTELDLAIEAARGAGWHVEAYAEPIVKGNELVPQDGVATNIFYLTLLRRSRV